MLVNGCEVAVVRDAGGCRQAAEVRARGAGRGRIPRRLRAVPAGRPPVRQSTGGGRRAQGAMFHCIVQPRNVWGPPDSPNAFPDIRMQLAEQTRVLEARAEATAGVAGELHDYCRRRAELEHEYARALDKLARAAAARHKDARHKRDAWALLGATAGWTAALDGARALARDHAALAELYGGALSARLARAAEDALRLHRKCRDVLAERHEEVGAALAEAAAAGKAHAAAAADWRAAALKLRHAYDTRARLQAADPPRHKKLRALDKELDKRRGRHAEARTRALRARADYVLALEAANATLQRYYLDDIADIILCMEVGFEAVVGRALRTAGEAESARAAAADGAGAALRAAADALDALADRQRLLDAHAPAFAPPRPLAWAGAAPAAQDADVRDLLGEAAGADEPGERAQRELAARLAQLEAGARALRLECREGAKTLDAAEAELLRQLDGGDAAWDVRAAFGPGGKGAAGLPAPPAPPPEDQEDYYLAKFRSYVSCAGRLARLESKAAGVRSRLLASGAGRPEAPPSPPTPPRRAAARLRRGQFAAPLEARLPVVLTSCVRVIAGYGLRHQGLFRVSGSQVEMQALRAAFERGEDPLAGVRDASDINSVCGLLKLFLRELRPPLLPPALQERLLRLAALPDDGAWAARARDTLGALPAPALLVLRYLFAFLAHLAEHAEHNMMDAWNLAICLGPTLLAAWGDGGAQVAQQNLLNELVKRIILHHERVFPQDVAPHALYTRRPPEDVAPDDTDSTAPPENGLAASHESPAPHEPPPPHAPGEPHESHEPHEPHESLGPLGDSHEEPDIGDDLSLYDDDDDEDDVTDEDGESGDWADRDSVDYHREAERRAPQVEPAADETAGAAAASSPQCRRLAETPDLVLDLPARAADPADTFAHNRDTLKKRPRRADAPPAPPAPPAPDGSPVPARNTARVAAKFAELTLTGGSLKPALAAKPALLRRPTPHPHARAAPPAPQAPRAPPEGDASADGAPRP